MKTLLIAVATLSFVFGVSSAKADQNSVSVTNELLRGEISAVETYRQALEKVGTEPGSDRLRQFHDDHAQAVTELQRHVMKLGGSPSTDSGAWGVWAKTVVGSAKVLGDTAALKALKEGEQHGVKEYKELLENKNASEELKTIVRGSILPKQEEHIKFLDQMIDKRA